jgi:hypothetical protein
VLGDLRIAQHFENATRCIQQDHPVARLLDALIDILHEGAQSRSIELPYAQGLQTVFERRGRTPPV